MDAHWYIYKNQQVEGPYTWEELNEIAAAGTINAEDLIWENTGREWKEASEIPGVGYQDLADAKGYTPPAQVIRSFFDSLSFNRIALIMTAVFLFSLSATSLYLYFSSEDDDVLDETGGMFDFDTIFGNYQENDQRDSAQNDLENADGYPGEEPGTIEDCNSLTGSTEQNKAAVNDDESDTAAVGSDYYQVEEDTITWQGGKYTGPLLNEQPHGKGLWRHPDGRNYAGDFEHGEITGYGTMTFAGGEKYVGSLYRGKAHGNGTLVHPVGRVYSGEFRHGIIEGYGTMTFPGGEQYTGYFKNGLGHGRGTMTHPDGESVSGTWTSGSLTEKD